MHQKQPPAKAAFAVRGPAMMEQDESNRQRTLKMRMFI
jgi:hypothetical protein